MDFIMIETGWLSLLPPIIAIALALITKEVYSSLLAGVFSGMVIDVIASDIVADFRALNMADVWLVFRRARSGHYGELYESLNTAKVEGWFHEYFNERCSAAEEESIRESERYKLDTRRVSETLREKEHRIAAGAMRIRMEGTPPE